jgi:uncharacterized protein YjbI with pentapeptide repeats
VAKVDYAAKLIEGAEAWNKWRRGAPDQHITIREADLARIDLPYANLSNISFEACDFRGANLDHVVCTRTHFFACRFDDVNLHNANLAITAFASCEMPRCDLTGAIITWSSFSGTNLSEARGLLETTTVRLKRE